MKIQSPYNGCASITREHFLFYEMRTTAKLLLDGITHDEVINKIVSENLFQYPTEKSTRQMAKTCLKRLECLDDDDLVKAIANQPSEIAKQVCLYAMMRQYRLMWDFMITVIGDKYEKLDTSFGKIDMNTFFMRLQEQDDAVASWSEGTVTRIKQVIIKILVENEYLDSSKADHLNPVLVSPILENAIREETKTEALPAFNCLS